MNKMNKINFPIYGWVGIASVCILSACNDSFMDRLPQTEIGVESYFNTEEDLKLCDGVIYVLDARAPYACFNKKLTALFKNTELCEVFAKQIQDSTQSLDISLEELPKYTSANHPSRLCNLIKHRDSS